MRSFIFYLLAVLDTLTTSFGILTSSLFRKDSIRRKKFIYRYFTKNWGKRLFYYTGSKIEMQGLEKIDPKQHYLILVNHQSNFDIYILIGFLNLPLCFLSKIQNFKIPVIGPVMRRMGCISIDRLNRRKSLESLKVTAERYEEGMSIVIYPEGTRSKTGEIKPFKSGFLHIIEKIEGPCHLLPVTLSGTRRIQKAGKLAISGCKIKMQIAEPVEINPQKLQDGENNYKKELLMELENTIRQSYEQDV